MGSGARADRNDVRADDREILLETEFRGVPPESTGVLTVDLRALRQNYAKLRSLAPKAETAAVVKADAYGLGIGQIAVALAREGCRTFFVATLGEARALRSVAPDSTIYVLDGLLPGSAPVFQVLGARPALGSLAEIEEWASFWRASGTTAPAAIHIDSGMTRLGLEPAAVSALVSNAELLAAVSPALSMSHLACADRPFDPKNHEQLERFEALSASLPQIARSLSNSAGIFLGDDYHFDLTRPGIALYGGMAQSEGANPMAPVVTLHGRIAQVRWAERGETAGYGATHTLKRRTRLITVTIGYADGFFRALSASDLRDGPPAYIEEFRLPLLGRVSMDLLTYDGTDVPEGLLARGGWVEILGRRVTVDNLAAFAGMIGYEVLTSLGNRFHRIFLDE